jgi:NAD-dependent SIR2 family protein deacetylase
MTALFLLHAAARSIAEADALLIGAGAGMGVDSGLPDFRGAEGLWNAYPAYRKLGLDFYRLANPRWFHDDIALAWGFYGHRLNLYRSTWPHDGFRILCSWAERMKHGAFVFTSNVDGHFQRAGFDPERVCEVHGSIHWFQCLADCGQPAFSSETTKVGVDEETMRAVPPFPSCPRCAGAARPNILMFNDGAWYSDRTQAQETNLEAWLSRIVGSRLVVIECGAGTAIPTVRRFCEQVASYHVAPLIRINIREPRVPEGQIGLAMAALEALCKLNGLLGNR